MSQHTTYIYIYIVVCVCVRSHMWHPSVIKKRTRWFAFLWEWRREALQWLEWFFYDIRIKKKRSKRFCIIKFCVSGKSKVVVRSKRYTDSETHTHTRRHDCTDTKDLRRRSANQHKIIENVCALESIWINAIWMQKHEVQTRQQTRGGIGTGAGQDIGPAVCRWWMDGVKEEELK